MRAARPHLLAIDKPPAVGSRAPGRDAGSIRTCIRLAEELTPPELERKRWGHPALHLVVRGLLHDRQRDIPGDRVDTPFNAQLPQTPARSQAAPRRQRRGPRERANAANR